MVVPAETADATACAVLDRPPRLTTASHPERIGAALEALRAELVAILDSLLKAVPDAHTALGLEAARSELDAGSCRIAVIGQVNAGKSSLINALTARPELLPTDTDPWSVAVCALHFRAGCARPEHAAAFHLFAADDWRKLADGAPHVRELGARLNQGFAPELLRAQLEAMRQRAERRLASRFEGLLGQCHSFKEVSPELLADYLGAGHRSAPAAGGERTHYADITRTADLYYDDGPFAFPVTLIDTPGVNDPLLVRDEVTRASLEQADICVLVVSALQPLSPPDLGLLRLLEGMHKDRVIVFITRTDQLPNPQANAAPVKAAVEQRLAAAFPALRLRVIAGSACGASPMGAGREAAAGAVARSGRSPPCEASPSAQLGNAGMRELAAAIGEMMCASGAGLRLRQLAAYVAALLKSAELDAEAELRAIEESRVLRVERSEAARTRIDEEQTSLALFEERADALRRSFREVGDQLHEIVKLGSNMLRSQLRDMVRDFSDVQADAFLRALPCERRVACDVAPLQKQVEDRYLEAIGRIDDEFARVEQFLYPRLKMIVAGLLPDYHPHLLESPAWPREDVPASATLSRLVSMDLRPRWWQQWLAARRPPLDGAKHLRGLIQHRFFPLIDELVAGAEQHLSLRVDYTLERANAIGAGLRIGVEQRRANLAAELALLNGSGDPGSLERVEREQCERTGICNARRASYSAALAQLAALAARLEALQDA